MTLKAAEENLAFLETVSRKKIPATGIICRMQKYVGSFRHSGLSQDAID